MVSGNNKSLRQSNSELDVLHKVWDSDVGEEQNNPLSDDNDNDIQRVSVVTE